MALRQIVFTETFVGAPQHQALVPPDLQAELQALPDVVAAVTITDEATYTAATTLVTTKLAPAVKHVKAFFAPLKKVAHEHHRALCDAESSILARLDELTKYAAEQATAYRGKIEEQRRIAEKAARELAERQAEEQRLAQATALADAGDTEAAEQLLAQPPMPTLAPEVHVPPPPKVAGVAALTRWTARVIDLAAFLRWVAADVESRGHLVTVAEGKLNQLAASQRKGFAVPGCVAEERSTTSFRAQ